VPLELKHYSDLLRHIKERQNGIYYLNFVDWTKTAETLRFDTHITSNKA